MPKNYDVNPKVDKRGLTKAQQVFTDNVLNVGKEKAAAMAYPDATPESQRVLASRNMDNPAIIHSIGKTLEGQGVTDETLCQAIKRGLDEENPKAYLKAAEIGFKLRGHLRDDRTILPVPVTKEAYKELVREFWGGKPQ